MSSTVIREFLVRLGYTIDSGTEQKFVNSLQNVTFKVTNLAHALVDLERLFFSATRTKASAEGIMALGYAAEQTGSSVESARQSLESFAAFIRSSPGAAGLLRGLGINTNQKADKVYQDTLDYLNSIHESQARVIAQKVGISDDVLMASRSPEYKESIRFSNEALKAFGVNAGKATEASHRFMYAERQLTRVIDTVRAKLAETLAPVLEQRAKAFTKWLLDNSTAIKDFIVTLGEWAEWAADRLLSMFSHFESGTKRLIAWWKGLDDGQRKALTSLAMFIVALKLFNNIAGSGVIGTVIKLAGLFLLLYDDYMRWKKGGDSIINWEKWEPVMLRAIEMLESLMSMFDKLAKAVGGWDEAFTLAAGAVLTLWAARMIGAILPVCRLLASTLGLIAVLPGAGALGAALTAALIAAGVAVAMQPSETNKHNDADIEAYRNRKTRVYPTDTRTWREKNMPKWLGGKDAPEPFEVDHSLGVTPEMQAFLRTTAEGESGGSYDVMNGGEKFDTNGPHPNRRGEGGKSTAAGKYQFIYETWMRMAAKTGRYTMTPENQEINAAVLAAEDYARNTGGRSLQADLEAARTDPLMRERIAHGLNKTWSSNPGGVHPNKLTGSYYQRLRANLEAVKGVVPPAAPDRSPPAGGPAPRIVPVPNGGGVKLGDEQYGPLSARALDPTLAAAGAAGMPSSRSSTLNQTTHITVNGARDPETTARVIEDRQARINNNLRNMQGAVT